MKCVKNEQLILLKICIIQSHFEKGECHDKIIANNILWSDFVTS